jgi:hypothetical protein
LSPVCRASSANVGGLRLFATDFSSAAARSTD